MITLSSRRAAKLLLLATKVAQPRELARSSEGPLHEVADSHSAKLSVAIRYAFASARAAMRRKLLSKEDIREATALGIVVLRQELKEILPKVLRQIYLEGGEVGASLLAEKLRVAGDYEGHPFRGNQYADSLTVHGKSEKEVRDNASRYGLTVKSIRKEREGIYYVSVSGDDPKQLDLYVEGNDAASDTSEYVEKAPSLKEQIEAAKKFRQQKRNLGDFEGHPFRGNQWTEGADGDGEIDRSVPTVPRDSQGTLLDKSGEPLTVYHGSVSREVDATTLELRDPVRQRPGQLDGIYFTSNPQAASAYTRVIGVKAPAGRIVQAQIRMSNPKDITKDIKAGQKRGLTFGDAKREALKSVTVEHDGVVFRGDSYNADEYMVRSRDQIRPVKTRNLEDFRFAKRESKPKFKIDFEFDRETQSAIDWADRHSAELITQISETSREDINNAVAEFLETGDFKELRDEILAAVGDSRRADLIARNEPMRAVHEGQREAWNQAVEEGLLPENAVREWIVVGDARVCPVCEELEGTTAELGGKYPGGYEGPPAHVNCRCSESITGSRLLGGKGSGNYGHEGRPGEVGGSGSGGVRSERSARALKHFKPIHAEAQRHAEANELTIRRMVGGIRTDDNLPVDVITQFEDETHGVEVKTMINNSNDKITMRKAAVEKKEAWARKNRAETHTVVIDDRGKLGHPDYSGHRVYYAKGHGSFRLGSMVKVSSAEHLRQLIEGVK